MHSLPTASITLFKYWLDSLNTSSAHFSPFFFFLNSRLFFTSGLVLFEQTNLYDHALILSRGLLFSLPVQSAEVEETVSLKYKKQQQSKKEKEKDSIISKSPSKSAKCWRAVKVQW